MAMMHKVARRISPDSVAHTFLANAFCERCNGTGIIKVGWRGRLFDRACSCVEIVKKENASRFDITV